MCKHHGYLTGEQFTCPYCGESAEVYSRITGYYRPVQNWNAGKTQEYKERREYVIENSHLTHNGPIYADKQTEAPAAPAEAADAKEKRTILFSRVSCPNCTMAANYLAKAGVEYEKVLADEHMDMAREFGVKQTPTLVVTDGEGGFAKYAGAGAIKQYLVG